MAVLLIHGGAGRASTPERREAIGAALSRIVAASWEVLARTGSALEAVVDANRRLEDDPLFNAGLGSKLQADGGARLSASLMDGSTERFSGVVSVEGVLNPIVLCRHLLDERDRVLCGDGARRRALELGLRMGDPRTPERIAAFEHATSGKTGTVGALALDDSGRLAAGTSTGGRGGERVGRVSDSCTVAGNYANAACAASTTGVGEQIVDQALALRLVLGVEAGGALADVSAAVADRVAGRGHEIGWIALDASGAWAADFTTEAMSWAICIDGRAMVGEATR